MDKKALFKLSYGLFIVGVENKGKLNGCIANTPIQVTSEKVQMAVTLSKNNYTTGLIQEKKYFSVSTLTEAASMDLIARFGFQSGKDVDKFKDFKGYKTDKKKTPYITEATNAVFFLKLKKSIDLGTHIMLIGSVEDAKVLSSDNSMTYKYYHEVKKGSTPKNAPSFNPGVSEESEEKKLYWRCQICGYEHDKKTFPDDMECPVCFQSAKEHFLKI